MRFRPWFPVEAEAQLWWVVDDRMYIRYIFCGRVGIQGGLRCLMEACYCVEIVLGSIEDFEIGARSRCGIRD